MSMVSKIVTIIREAKALDKTAHISDYQVKVVEQGAVLINLKTREAVLIKADQADDFPLEESIAE